MFRRARCPHSCPLSPRRVALSLSPKRMSNYTYLDPLEGVGASIQPDLEDKRAADGKSMENPPREGSSEWYTSCPVVFTPPGADGRNNNFE